MTYNRSDLEAPSLHTSHLDRLIRAQHLPVSRAPHPRPSARHQHIHFEDVAATDTSQDSAEASSSVVWERTVYAENAPTLRVSLGSLETCGSCGGLARPWCDDGLDAAGSLIRGLQKSERVTGICWKNFPGELLSARFANFCLGVLEKEGMPAWKWPWLGPDLAQVSIGMGQQHRVSSKT